MYSDCSNLCGNITEQVALRTYIGSDIDWRLKNL